MSDKLTIVLLGSGGREHALLKKLAESPRAGKLYALPGNGGMSELATCVAIDIEDGAKVRDFAKEVGADLVVIGPEAPLVKGVADELRSEGIACFGPSKAAAQMEGSKRFAKEVMEKAQVDTAKYKAFTVEAEALAYVEELAGPCVVKADGLAAGKGVFVCDSTEAALSAVKAAFSDFGDAGSTVVIEEMLEGPECSLLALTDGTTVKFLSTAQDHKRAYDDDEGPNTGGMGVYSPVPILKEGELEKMQDAMQHVVDYLRESGNPYSGCLYGGFMLTKNGPKVLEFNARFGDPETQVILPRLKADLVELMLACDADTLHTQSLDWTDDYCVSVVLASAGYPGSYEKGKTIVGIDKAEQIAGVEVYHAGTSSQAGEILTAGGRVLNVVGRAATFEKARNLCYQAIDLIDFEGKQYRHDIGIKALKGRQD